MSVVRYLNFHLNNPQKEFIMKTLAFILMVIVYAFSQDCNTLSVSNLALDTIQRELDSLYNSRNALVKLKSQQWDELRTGYDKIDYVRHLAKYNLLKGDTDSLINILIEINNKEIEMRMLTINLIGEKDPCEFKWKLNVQCRRIRQENSVLANKLMSLSQK